MKKIITIITLLITINTFSQTYVTKEGDTLTVGQPITLGIPTGAEGFRFLTQGNQPVANWLAGTEVTIHKFKKVRGKTYVLFKGYGLLPIYIDYEIARQTGEVEKPRLIPN